MTREMNKEEWQRVTIQKRCFYSDTYLQKVSVVKRELNPLIAEFFWATCERFKK